MKKQKILIFQNSIFFSLLLISAGYSATLRIEEPQYSTKSYKVEHNDTITIKIVDNRTLEDRNEPVYVGIINKESLILKGFENSLPTLCGYLSQEFLARGLNVNFSYGKKSTVALHVSKYQIIFRKNDKNAPVTTLILLKGSMNYNDKTVPINAFFMNRKKYKISLREIQKSCISVPMEIITKELVTKINNILFGLKLGDDYVLGLHKNINKNYNRQVNGPWRNIIILGHSSNRIAIDHLIHLSAHPDGFARACALSAIGLIGINKDLPFLVSCANKYKGIDRYMALKSIGDIGTKESVILLEQVKNSHLYESDYVIKICVDLYLD